MIKFDNVNKVWPNGKHALKNINLEIEDGEFVAIIGLSGAGKTTLLKTINQINTITSGEIIIDFYNKYEKKEEFNVHKIKGKKLIRLRQKIGLMSQEYNNIEKLSVLKNVLNARISRINFWRSLTGIFSRYDKEIALKSLEKLNLLEYAYARVENLSGGQQQRIALARTISQHPALIIADEPVSALDPILANQVMNDFALINKTDKITVIINIHHVELAKKYATRIIGVKDGEIVFNGPSKDLNEEKLKLIYGENY
ncbi:phosphonate ABC transporter ATP-binding protein [Spiroplasma tabanidicola]|uniref:Phosphonate transport system ATP-binding protein n=1 Tax=Spiroplasma tabanidicola TaxID=324079 RepID=A0A6I6C9T4_9MOLU|nr:phosphonate ABC transporter ATP-binding protein [Spiroplasma tabanidicola]QGS51661.1 phosphonate transport system ATP-binding protein [Spiroplasma tabanidicola]